MLDNKFEEPEIIEVTGKTAEVLLFIGNYIDEKGFSPSKREICRGVNLKSTSSVAAQLKKLENLGFIKRKADCPRAISVVGKLVS